MENVQAFFDYAQERAAITARRAAGDPPPWTENTVLRRSHHCSVIRDDDRTSREAKDIIVEYAKEEDGSIAPAMWFRLLNRASTLQRILHPDPAPETPAPRRFAADVLKVLEALPPPVFNTIAYRIQVRGGLWNLSGVSELIARAEREAQLGWQPAATARQTAAQLRSFGFGPFVAYQSMQDLRWVAGPYSDEDEWCVIGGGALRGIRRLTGEYRADEVQRQAARKGEGGARSAAGVASDTESAHYMPMLVELLPGLREIDARANLMEVEHNLCEFDKYERVRTGETPGRRYTGAFRGADEADVAADGPRLSESDAEPEPGDEIGDPPVDEGFSADEAVSKDWASDGPAPAPVVARPVAGSGVPRTKNPDEVEMRDVPIPELRINAAKRYPWDKLRVGGPCFLFDPGITISGARSSADTASRRDGKTYTARKLPDGRIGCWRVE